MSTREFSFPLNVYARLLELREGGCDYLHFAVFERPDEAVRRAQERASELLWQALPPPGKLLEVGIGLGTTLSRLKAAGHDAVGITPELAQMREAVRRNGADLPLRCSRLEDFAEDAGRWQTLLFQESAQYIAPLALFGAAERLLTRGPASLVVMDEFALQRRDAGDWGLHHLGHFMALAERFGWRLTQHTDLSNAVQPTLHYLLRALADERERLLADLDLRAQDFDELQSALRRSLTQYQQGRFGYALLRWQRDSGPDRPAVGADARPPTVVMAGDSDSR